MKDIKITFIDYNGNLVVKYDCSSYGQILSITGSLKDTLGKYNSFRYKGYYYMDEIGLYWLKSRYYDPETGRFISPDSIDYLEPESIYGLNLYAYCGNDPVNKINDLDASIMMFAKGHQGNMRSSKYAYWTTEELLVRHSELSGKGHLTSDEKKEKREIETELKARGERNKKKRKGYAHSNFMLTQKNLIIKDSLFYRKINKNFQLKNENSLILAGDLLMVGGLIIYVIANDTSVLGVADDFALVALIPLFIILEVNCK